LHGASAYELLGDEAALILQKVPGAIVVKNADRVAGAQRAIELGCDTLILDDGFQYLRLARDEDIVLIDATNPFGNGHLLPRGILREPVTALSRATSIIVTHADAAPNCSELDSRLRALAPQASVRHTRHAPVAVRNLATGERLVLEILRGRVVNVACAIANPQHFVDTIRSLGCIVSAVSCAGDHAPIHLARCEARSAVVVTEKDAVRMKLPTDTTVFAIEIKLENLGPIR
jgi:tetraacyldisaccharide 4'-kinase